MGDVGYLDKSDRFWCCGRKNHRVRLDEATMYTIRCEAIFNQHPAVYRSALVGIGDSPQTPVLIAECWPEKKPSTEEQKRELLGELAELGQQHDLTTPIAHYLLHESLPVDIRHNSKIFREKLREWARSRIQA